MENKVRSVSLHKNSQIWLGIALVGTVVYSICAILIGSNSLLVKVLSLLSLILWWLFISSRWKYKKDENEFWDGRNDA